MEWVQGLGRGWCCSTHVHKSLLRYGGGSSGGSCAGPSAPPCLVLDRVEGIPFTLLRVDLPSALGIGNIPLQRSHSSMRMDDGDSPMIQPSLTPSLPLPSLSAACVALGSGQGQPREELPLASSDLPPAPMAARGSVKDWAHQAHCAPSCATPEPGSSRGRFPFLSPCSLICSEIQLTAPMQLPSAFAFAFPEQGEAVG